MLNLPLRQETYLLTSLPTTHTLANPTPPTTPPALPTPPASSTSLALDYASSKLAVTCTVTGSRIPQFHNTPTSLRLCICTRHTGLLRSGRPSLADSQLNIWRRSAWITESGACACAERAP